MSNTTVIHKSELSAQQLSCLRKDIQALIQQLREDLDTECYQQQADFELAEGSESTDGSELAGGVEARSDAVLPDGREHRLENLRHIYQLEQEIRLAERALHRIDSGSYGECASCREAIELNRLKANPVLALCVSCQSGSDV